MRLFHSATIFFAATHVHVFVVWNFTRLVTRLERLFFLTQFGGGTQLQCIYYLCRILISRPPRVFRRFKRRCCKFVLHSKSAVLFQKRLWCVPENGPVYSRWYYVTDGNTPTEQHGQIKTLSIWQNIGLDTFYTKLCIYVVINIALNFKYTL